MTTYSEKTDVAGSPNPPQSYVRRGALIGGVIGLIPVWIIVAGAYDPNVTDHSPIFPTAVTIVCVFACIVLFVFTFIGGTLGAFMKR